MTAQRRDGDGDTTDSAARIWQLYADHIGLPNARPAEGNEPLQRRPRSRRLRTGVVAGVSVVGVVLLAAVAGTALWSYSPTAVVLPERPVPAPIPVPIAADLKSAEPAAAPAASRTPRIPDTPIAPPRIHASSSSATYRPDEAAAGRAPRAAVAQPERTSFSDPITFEFGSDRLAVESLRALDKVVVAMKANPDWRLTIEGHTDSHGAPEYNQALSERRAEAVKAQLESAGVAPHRLRVHGFGASRPVVPNDGQRDFINRRVEFRRR